MTRAPEVSRDSARQRSDALLLSDVETARRLGIGKTKCRELIKSGELQSVRIGRRLLVPRSAIEEYLGRLLNGQGRS